MKNFKINTSISYQNNVNNIRFGAKKIAEFKLDKVAPDKTRDKAEVEIFSLDKDDIPVLLKISEANQNNVLFNHSSPAKNNSNALKSIIDGTVKHIIATIKMMENFNLPYKPVNLIAISNGNPLGLVTGLSPKITKDLNIIYSTSGIEGEVEPDWCVNWKDKADNSYKGLGQILVSSLFKQILNSKFPIKSVYSRSEVPNKTIAHDFYKNLGLEDVNSIISLDKKGDPVELNLLFSPEERTISNDPVIPMRINADTAKEMMDIIFLSFNRKESSTPEKNYDLKNILKI